MKNKSYVLVNLLISLFIITLTVLFVLLLDINKPTGLSFYLGMTVFSLVMLWFFTFYTSYKETTPSSFLLISGATYALQFSPLIVFFLSSDDFIDSNLIMVPISVMFIFVIAYVAIILLFTYFNKVAVETDKKLEGKTIEPENTDSYYDEDGNFKGLS